MVNLEKEIRGLLALNKHKIDAPVILHQGTADNGKVRVVLLKTIVDAMPLKLVWQNCVSDDEKLSLLKDLVSVVASHHNAGLMQGDLHLNNFVCADGKIYTLDGGDVKIHKGQLNTRQSLNNFGQLLSLFFPENDRFLPVLFSHYMELRGQPQKLSLQKKLAGKIEKLRYNRFSKYVRRKIFRNCSEFTVKNESGRLTIVSNTFMSPKLMKIINDPDASLDFDHSRMIKKGNSATVWSCITDKHKYVIKRYNYKGFWPALKRCFRESNAARSWKNAHLLNLYGIVTAKPVALIEEQDGFLLKRAYLITVQLEGVDCIRGFSDDQMEENEKNKFAKQIVKLFNFLKELKIGHGDMKGSNIFLTPAGPCLIDLDSMRQYRFNLFFEQRFRRDVFRFMRNWQKNPSTCFLFLRLLQ